MSARLTSAMLVAALRRRIEAAGGFCTMVARGYDTAGAILVLAHRNRRNPVLLERRYDVDAGYAMSPTGPQVVDDIAELEDYAERRRAADPDLWVIDADVADAERFAAETIAGG